MAKLGANCTAVLFATIGVAFLLFSPVLSAEAARTAAPVEEIIVTGSRIARRDFVAPSPIATLDEEVLRSNGQATLEEALNQMPQVIPEFERTSNNPGDGTARVNLRGLGSNRTLVLLNGRRVAPSGVGSSVDLNNLPEALVERVEVITGGAATVYGSDAVAGVVNVITRQDFQGFALDTSLHSTERGDSEFWDLNAAAGFDLRERGNVTLFAGYYDREPSFAADRKISAVPLVDDWRGDGGLIVSGSDRTPAGVVLGPPADLGEGPTRVTFEPDGNPRAFEDPADRYNTAGPSYLQTPLERQTFGLFANYRFLDALEGYAEVTHTENQAGEGLASVPFVGFTRVNLDNPELTDETRQVFADNYIPLGPGLVGFGFGRRMVELGSREIEHKRKYTRTLLGLRGVFGNGWDYDLWASHTRSRELTTGFNALSRSAFEQGLLVTPDGECFDPSDGCVPVNPFGEGRLSEAAAGFIAADDPANETRRDQYLVSGFVRGAPLDTWAGPVELALGAEWRRDRGSFRSDPALQAGDTLGYGSGLANVDGEEEVSEFYFEALLPLAEGLRFAQSLTLELGARHSRYEHAGSVNTWKVGVGWVPLDGLFFRGMLQRAVRAPNLLEAFEEQYSQQIAYVGNNPAEDPCSASADPIGNGHTERCVITGLPEELVGVFEANVGFPSTFYFGGNEELEPEKADTFTLGVVLNPSALPNWQFAVDYFDLEIKGGIEQLVSTVACFDPLNENNLFCDTIRRNPLTYDVSEVFEPNVNRGGQHTRGVDTQVNADIPLPEGAALLGNASIGFNLIWTRTFENSLQEIPGGTSFDCGGKFGWPCMFAATGNTFAENRVHTRLSYSTGGLTGWLAWQWIEGTENGAILGAQFQGIEDPEFAIPAVGNKSFIDLGFAYRFTDNVLARLVITNLFDTDPPLMADAVISNNTDTTMFDIFGRSYTLSLSLQF